MKQLALLRSMLLLVEQRMEERGTAPVHDPTALDLEADSPEAVFIGYVQSLDTAELKAFRTEICRGAMRLIDEQLAQMEAG